MNDQPFSLPGKLPDAHATMMSTAVTPAGIAVSTAVRPLAPELLTKAEAAQFLGVSTRTIDNLMRQRRISYVKLTSKIVRFPRAEILQHIRECLTVHAHVTKRD